MHALTSTIIVNPHIPEDRDTFITKNLRLVHSVCQRYKKRIREDEYEDLASVGSIGLLKAYEKFDPTRFDNVTAFSTYAVPMIQGEIQRYFRDHNPGIKFSRSTKEAVYKIRTIKFDGYPEWTDNFTLPPEFLAERLGISLEIIKSAIYYQSYHQPDYLERIVFQNDGDEIALIDQVGSSIDYTRYVEIESFISQVDERMALMITLMVQGKTQTQIGNILGISQVQVSRLQSKLMEMAHQYAATGSAVLPVKRGLPKLMDVVAAMSKAEESVTIIEPKQIEEEPIVAAPVSNIKSRTEQAKHLLATTKLSIGEISRKTQMSWPTVSKYEKEIRGEQNSAEKPNAAPSEMMAKIDETIAQIKDEAFEVARQSLIRDVKDNRTPEELIQQARQLQADRVAKREAKEETPLKIEDKPIENESSDIFEQSFSTRIKKDSAPTSELESTAASAVKALTMLGINTVSFELTIKSK